MYFSYQVTLVRKTEIIRSVLQILCRMNYLQFITRSKGWGSHGSNDESTLMTQVTPNVPNVQKSP